MQITINRILSVSIVTALWLSPVMAQRTRPTKPAGMSSSILLQIVRAEDERRWDDSLKSLLTHSDPGVRARAALAAGRIGAQGAVEPWRNGAGGSGSVSGRWPHLLGELGAGRRIP